MVAVITGLIWWMMSLFVFIYHASGAPGYKDPPINIIARSLIWPISLSVSLFKAIVVEIKKVFSKGNE